MTIGRPRKITPELALQKAVDVFWRYGYQATSMADLVKATGLHKGSLYQLYGSKEQLFIAALNTYIQEIYESTQAIAIQQPDPVMGLHEIFMAILNRFETKGCQGCMVSNSLNGDTLKLPEVRRILAASMQMYVEFISELLIKIEAQTALRLNCRVEDASHLLMMLIIGMSEHLQINQAKQQVRHVLQTQLNCLLPGYTDYLQQAIEIKADAMQPQAQLVMLQAGS